MRTSLRRTTVFVAAVFSISAVMFTGCQTSSGFKAPSTSNWFSWGKKKPETTLSSTRPSTQLPAPPSSSTTPSTAPSYAQGSGGMRYGENSYGAQPGGSGTAYGQNNYAAQPNAGNYSNASYGGARESTATAQAPTGRAAGAAQGFYSQDYRGSQAPGAQGYGAAPTNGYAGGYISDGYGAGTAGTAPAAAPRSNSPYGSTPGYGGSTYAQAPNSTAPTGYPANPGATYGAPASPGYGQTPAYPTTGQSGPIAQNPVAPGSYRPGSTSRNTQFGTSDSINVAGRDSVQPASFAGTGAGSTAPNTGAPAPSTYGSDPYSPAPQTATGGSNYSYPQNYQR